MAKYLWHGSYSVDGINGVLKDGGTGRVRAIEQLVKSVGGTVELVYFAFGKDDFYITVNLPGNVNAAAAALRVAATGAASVQTIVLLTPEEVDAATKVGVEYRRPGG